MEQLVEIANNQYRNQRLAVIHKVPTEWLPLARLHHGEWKSGFEHWQNDRGPASISYLELSERNKA